MTAWNTWASVGTCSDWESNATGRQGILKRGLHGVDALVRVTPESIHPQRWVHHAGMTHQGRSGRPWKPISASPCRWPSQHFAPFFQRPQSRCKYLLFPENTTDSRRDETLGPSSSLQKQPNAGHAANGFRCPEPRWELCWKVSADGPLWKNELVRKDEQPYGAKGLDGKQESFKFTLLDSNCRLLSRMIIWVFSKPIIIRV